MRPAFTAFFPMLLATLACVGQPEEHGHDAGGGHDHGGGHGHGAEDGGESIAVTRWTDEHELFVELDAPVAGQAFAYHAHVTRLSDNHAAMSGALTMRFERDGRAVASHTDDAVARAGIFAAEASAPKQPGRYQLLMSYADGNERAEWDAGEVVVGDGEAVAHEGEAEGEIAFLKESQWQIPFGVAPAAERALAPTVSASGMVRPAPSSTAIVAAPVEGLVAWAEVLPVVGRTVKRGERLATLIPAGTAEHWVSLEAELVTARIDRDLAQTDLRRVEGLAPDQLVSARRIDEARAALARAKARVEFAEQHLSVLSSGSAGTVPIRAPADGMVVAVGAKHGQAVSAGTPLVSVNAGEAVLIEAHVHARAPLALSPVVSLSVLRGGWDAPRDLLKARAQVLTEQLIYDDRSLSAPVSVLVPTDAGLVPGDMVELTLGIGAATPRLVVPRSAVIEINGQDVVFVQKTGESFTRRRVVPGERDPGYVEITSGLKPGEMVVIKGGFDVHIASLSSALESHRH